MTLRFDMIGLVVLDMAASVAFYRSLGLTFPEGAESEGHVEATLPNGLRFALDTVDVILTFDPAWKAPIGSSRVGLAFLCRSPEDVDAKFADLVASGVTPHKEPWDAFWGQRYAVVKDPDGNTVDLFAPLS
ncbi:VOC family protein [Deinococcus yavapaiensis]|uniref:Putative glyoxalase superfamily protein PhnB n=1 Tax=Deinococcus yavapaiensis KR-236 TaxID=694435 RepID=A0A318S9L6_9DEIO|nr:VOC family protein [Deinococcus yavapaiensis]PYE54918.1 putative glyoxalase superfamily protein PhnB [Deinococcus yavapaiensis KR-236]